ncbi:MAG: hypothetical protein UV46_C0045G0003 [Candidatus Gottesmanbacteria bacterium GW2011_GWC2_42_8]|nr:MAG: hypothetical protein UV46_C0045G0003 [Candidatus Gottesmanbacteria bacterium GW2011_GWC2_42_8]
MLIGVYYMNTAIQLKINLTEELQELLKSKASKFGIPLTQYVKHVLMKDVEDQEYPIFKASEETERAAREALQQLDKAVNAKSFFQKLHK